MAVRIEDYVKKNCLDFLVPDPLKTSNLITAGLFACTITDTFIKRVKTKKTVCGPNCGHCCSGNTFKGSGVNITAPEIMLIKQYCNEHDIAVPEAAKKEKCIFLDDSLSCIIHEVRPVRCRGWNSVDVEICKYYATCDPKEDFDVKNCHVDFMQFEVARKTHTGLIKAISGVGFTDPLYTITKAFGSGNGIPAAMLFEGIWMALLND